MKNIIFIITSILLFISCKNNNEITEALNSVVIPNGSDNEILPLSIGNTWNYKEYEYQDDTLLISRDVKLEVLGKIEIEYYGEKLEAIRLKKTRIFSEDNIYELFFLLRNENDTIYWYGHSLSDSNDYYFNKTVYIKYPIQVGENWIMNHGDYHDNFTCESVEDTVKLNDKDYSCVRIRMGPGHWYKDTYFSLGIGIVQIESTSGWENNCNLRRQILISSIIY